MLKGIYFIAYHLGIIEAFFRASKSRQVVISYHHVLPDRFVDGSPLMGLCHRQSTFSKQMEIIARRWPKSSPDSDAGCMITFDDGYRNNFRIAAPILERNGLRGIFFVSLDLVCNGHVLWPDRALAWISQVPPGEYQLFGSTFRLDDARSRAVCWSFLYERVFRDYGSRDPLLREMDQTYAFSSLPLDSELKALRLDPMATDELRELANRGHLIGCHSFAHDILSCLSESALENDFRICEREIGGQFNCTLYAYPFGGAAEVPDTVRQVCSQSKFTAAYMNVANARKAGSRRDRYRIERISLPDRADPYLVEAVLSGFHGFLQSGANRAHWLASLFRS